MRPKQWTKNVFVIAPLVFAQKVGDPHLVRVAAAAFFAFSLMASGVYIINDWMDVEEDKKHPQKKHRPIASGELPVPFALGVSALLFAGSAALAWWVGTPFALIQVLYLMMNLAYSVGLKQVVILDVMMIAAGFVIRAIAGSVAIGVEVSDWLFLCTTMVSLFLGFTKRRQELVHLGEGAGTRRSLSNYNVAFLDQMIAITTSSTVLTYALYTLSPEVSHKLGTKNLRWTVPFVLFGIFRYLYLVHVRHVPGDPTATLLADGPSIVNVVVYAIVVMMILY